MRVAALVLVWAVAAASAVDLCSQSFCACPDAGKRVECKCDVAGKSNLKISKRSLPRQTEHLSLSGCGDVAIATDSFAHCSDLSHIEFINLKGLELGPTFYSKKESDFREVQNFTISSVGLLEISPRAFSNFPKTGRAIFSEVGLKRVTEKGLEILADLFVIKESEIGVLERGSVYSDASELSIKNNRIELIEEGAFDASVRKFDFIGNTVDFISHNGMSVACLHGKIVGNTFKNQTGSPLMDFGPDPVCVPDPDTDPYEEDVVYNVVSNPVLEFTDNFFQTFGGAGDMQLLNFPGANNVPLGSLDIRGNKVRCNCESLKELAALADFEHVVPREHVALERGAVLFRKEFYDSGLCVDDATGNEVSLKAFMRDRIVVVEPGEDEEDKGGRSGSGEAHWLDAVQCVDAE